MVTSVVRSIVRSIVSGVISAAVSFVRWALDINEPFTTGVPSATGFMRQADGTIALETLPADLPAFEGLYLDGSTYSDTLPDGTSCHPKNTVDGNAIYQHLDERVDSTAYAAGDQVFASGKVTGSDVVGVVDFTSGWSTFSATVDDADSFTTTGAGGVIKNFGLTIGQDYVLDTSGISTTASGFTVVNHDSQATPVIASSAGRVTFTATNASLYIRNDDAGTTDVTLLKCYPDLQTTDLSLTCSGDGTSDPSLPIIVSADIDGTVTDGGVTWRVGGYYYEGAGMVRMEDALTNKVTCRKANPTDTTNLTLSGDPAATLTVVDDSAALATVGLDLICTSGKVYKLDNSGGSTAAFASAGGVTGNTNAHSFGCFAYSSGSHVSNLLRLSGGGGGSAIIDSSKYTFFSVENDTPGSTAQAIEIRVQQGYAIYFILPGLYEAAQTPDTPIVLDSNGDDVLASVTRPATLLSTESAGKIREGNCLVDAVVTPLYAGQTGWLLSSYVDANNYTGVYVTPTTVQAVIRVGGVDNAASVSYTHGTTQFRVQAGWDSNGLRCDVQEKDGAWIGWSTDAQDVAQIGTALEVGSLNGGERVESDYGFVHTIFTVAAQAEAERRRETIYPWGKP